MRATFSLLLALILAGVLPASPVRAAETTSLPVLTDIWPPYVMEPHNTMSGSGLGSAARIVRLVLHDMGYTADFQYFDFAYSFDRVLHSDSAVSFPYFRTPTRETQVLFSDPLFEVRNRLYYNRQYHESVNGPANFSGLRFGQVAGYSYGAEMDAVLVEPVIFSSEQEAMRALLNNDIDLLPMTDSVAMALLQDVFPDQLELVRSVAALDSVSSLHLIAPATEQGTQFIERFNASHKRLLQAGIVSDVDLENSPGQAQQTDVVELVVAEGYPVIVGNTRTDPPQHFAIPQGTRAMVLRWSDLIREASSSEQIYRTMTDESQVVVLNDPHVGKELYIKNMHLQIVPTR